jgi:hypothetical protein
MQRLAEQRRPLSTPQCTISIHWRFASPSRLFHDTKLKNNFVSATFTEKRNAEAIDLHL